MRQFKVGDRVKIRKTSQYYSFGDVSNPANIVGEITSVTRSIYTTYDDPDEEHHIQVTWPNYRGNCYRSYDLEYQHTIPLFEELSPDMKI